MDKPLIWVFGNAVQDVTVEVDVDTLIRDNASLIGSIALKDTFLVRKGSVLTTQFSGQELGVDLTFENAPAWKEEPDLYSLSKGGKYTLTGRVGELGEHAEWTGNPNTMPVHCEDVTWGGGGINVCRSIRSLAPGSEQPKIRYTDYGMSRSFDQMVKDLGELRLTGETGVTPPLIWKLATFFAKHSPERCLEVFLASLLIEPFLFRPNDPVFLRNWVFSSVRNAEDSIHDKIVCRSHAPNENDLGVTEEALNRFLESGDDGAVGAVVLNSIKHRQLFESAYDLYRKMETRRRKSGKNDFVGIMAMTPSMQEFLPYIRKKSNDGAFPPFILVFNDEEAVEFARKLGTKVRPIIRAAGDLPNVRNFARVVDAIRQHFRTPFPRIYVTIGARGSLGWDGTSQQIIHVSYYSRQGDTLFDTNGCGDAYCAAITLLEWAKRCCTDRDHIEPQAHDHTPKEMLYFMSVATAAAYCKARDRRGRIDSKTIRALLEDTYLGSGVVGFLDDVLKEDWEAPTWVDKEGRARRPPDANFRSVPKTLSTLFSTRRPPAA